MRKTIRLLSLITMMLIIVFPAAAFADSGVIMAQATSGESGLSNQKAGDQTGKEVATAKWTYGEKETSPFHWKYVFRAKDPEVAKGMAENMKAACENDHVGYDQASPDRYSLHEEAKKVGWDISKITTDCETTCSSVVSVCINAEGIPISKVLYSEIVYEKIMATGAFDYFDTEDYTASPDKLLPGDILCCPDHHTAMIVESPNHYQSTLTYKDKDKGDTEIVLDDGSEVFFNPENGGPLKKVVMNGDKTVKSPKKGPFRFIGWKKISDNLYAAEYEQTPAILTGITKMKKIR